jgi:membrane protein implicated in regulation of membrane protease activity
MRREGHTGEKRLSKKVYVYKLAMNPKTPRALVQFAAILAVVGIVIMDPLAGLSILVLAGILAVIALAFGSRRVRLVALLILLIIAAFSVWKYPDARRHLERYRNRTLADRHSITLPRGAARTMKLNLTGEI